LVLKYVEYNLQMHARIAPLKPNFKPNLSIRAL
jgi:hypothetical protein